MSDVTRKRQFRPALEIAAAVSTSAIDLIDAIRVTNGPSDCRCGVAPRFPRGFHT